MSDSDRPPHPSPPPRRDWNALSALIASLIGLLALGVSAHSAWLQSRQARAEVWPHLAFYRHPAEQSFQLVNKGVGPAVIRRATVGIDGSQHHDWAGLLDAMSLDSASLNYTTVADTVLQPGEAIRMIHFEDPAAWAAFDRRRLELTLRICYCSVFEECWVLGEQSALSPPVGNDCPGFGEPAFRN